jgi:glycosyltransferase involved in cell wall biosynthesis
MRLDLEAMRVLQISHSDSGGGASIVAATLFHEYQKLGIGTKLLVNTKTLNNADVELIDNDAHRGIWFRTWQRFVAMYDAQPKRIRGLGRVLGLVRDISQIPQWYRSQNGIEEFDFPGSSFNVERLAKDHNIVHAHNLHGEYFDLRQLVELSQKNNVVLNLHDAWLFSGHCAFSLGCSRWQTGCGDCPDLSIFPSIKKDATNKNWLYKQVIFSSSRLYITCPSVWLMEQAKRSILNLAAEDYKVIPNGVDTDVYYPRDKALMKAKLGISQDTKVLMIAASGLRKNQWKDFETTREALKLLKSKRDIVLLAVGGTGESEVLGQVELRFIDFQDSSAAMAELYSASDIYIHSSIVEVFGNVLLEARACGTPVVSSAVGGIPEHVVSIDWAGLPDNVKVEQSLRVDGVLCGPSDPVAFASAIQVLLDDESLLAQLSLNATKNMVENYNIKLQVERTLEWYSMILDKKNIVGRV